MAKLGHPIIPYTLPKLARLLRQFKCFIRHTPPWWVASLNNAVGVRVEADNGWSHGRECSGLSTQVDRDPISFRIFLKHSHLHLKPIIGYSTFLWSKFPVIHLKTVHDSQSVLSPLVHHLFSWVLDFGRQKPKECWCEWISGKKWWPLTSWGWRCSHGDGGLLERTLTPD